MDGLVINGPLRFFLDVDDPRAENVRYRFIDLLVIAICAVICGCDAWDEVEDFAESKKKWFGSFLDLSHGIPSHDTFERVFARIDPQELETAFVNWMSSLVEVSQGKLLAIDGKSMRRSFEKGWDKSGMAHMVSLFATENGQVLRQLKTEGKGLELPAILELLKLADLKGALVTIDALACQKEVAQTIVERGGDYILSVKDNQKTLHRSVKKHMDELILEHKADPSLGEGFPFALDHQETNESGHGRLERRRVWVTNQIDWLKQISQWAGLSSLIVVESARKVGLEDKTIQRRYYISSLKSPTAKDVARAIRGHWGIENGLHYVLDVSFNEDGSRVRKGHGPENLSRLRRIALNLLKTNGDKLGKRKSIKGRRKIAGWDHDFLLGLLTH